GSRSLLAGVVAAVVALVGLGALALFLWSHFSGSGSDPKELASNKVAKNDKPADSDPRPSEWREFASTDGGFTVLLPAQAIQKDVSEPKIVAAKKIREVRGASSGQSFAVQFYDLADRPINDHLYFRWLKSVLLEKGGKLVGENEVTPTSYPCKEIVVDLPADKVLVRRVYLAEARVFLVSAEYPKA